MTPHQILVVGSRLLAIVWVLYVIGQIPFIMGQHLVDDDGFNSGYVVGFYLVNLAICTILWFFPASIARKLLPSPKNDVVHANPPSSLEWLTVGSIVIGLWVLTGAASDAVYWFVYTLTVRFDQVIEVNDQAKAQMFATGAEVVVGALLIFGARSISALLLGRDAAPRNRDDSAG